MWDTYIIAGCVVGGCVSLALFVLIIYKCCQRRKRESIKKDINGQNGHVWQAHGKDVELGDEKDPEAKKLNEDGLCKETNAGSTFPRRIKADHEDQSPEPKKEDGLCQDTENRFTYPRRGKPEKELLLPVNKKNPSAFETTLQYAFPVGVSVITSFGSNEEKNDISKSNNDVQVHSVHKGTAKKQVQDKRGSSNFSSDSDDTSEHKDRYQHLISSGKKGRQAKKYSRALLELKRSKSFHADLEDFPEYSKPIKRSVSTPSIIAREKLLREDKRFESLKTWRSTIPLPEPDYHVTSDVSNTRLTEDDEQDHAPPSNATSDSGVECLDALSGHDDESLNHCDSVPESPGIPSSQLTSLRDDSCFSSHKEHTSHKESMETRYNESNVIRNTNSYGFNANVVAMATKDHTALIDANAVNDSISPPAYRQDRFFPSHTTENTVRITDLPYNDPKMALRNTSDGKWPGSASASNNLSKTTEQQMDFRSVKLKPATKNYEQSNSTTVYGVNKGDNVVAPLHQSENVESISLMQQKTNTKTEMVSTQPSITSVTDGPKDHYVIGFSNKLTAKTERSEVQRASPETETRTDFQRIKLRQTPQSLKEHIAFREELEPNLSATQTTQKHEENTISDTREEAKETTIGVLDGIRKFQTQGVQDPKPSYGSHYISKKDPNSKPVNIVPQELVRNLKPVNIVPPEPSTIDMRKTTNTSAKPNHAAKEVNVIPKENPSMVITNNVTKRPVSMLESVTSEDKRHFRYSTGNLNQSHATRGFNASQKTEVVIREQGKQETTTRKQDSLEKPVAIVTPQSPKLKRESPEERAAFEEARKKNLKREQIEQKLETAHVRTQNDQFFPASGLAYRSCMPELFSKIKQIGDEKDEGLAEH